jgi:hypothetical protein
MSAIGKQWKTFVVARFSQFDLERLLVGPKSRAQRDLLYGECHAPLRGEPAMLLMMRFSRDFLDVHARYEVLIAAKGGGL